MAAENGDKGKAKIVWGQAATKSTTQLEEEEAREKHRQRAARFNTDYVEPGLHKKATLQDQARSKSRSKPQARSQPRDNRNLGLPTPEEITKRRQRAERFNLITPEESSAEEAKQRRAAKFGLEYKPLQAAKMDVDIDEESKVVPADVPKCENAVHLYGVDLMNTQDVMSYFQEYAPLQVDWMNDSTCNVVFDDSITAKKAIVKMGTPLPAEAEAPDSKGSEGLDVSDIRNLPFFWHKGPDFKKDDTAVSLLFRMATEADKKDPSAPKNMRALWKSPYAQGGRGPRGRGRGASAGGKRSKEELLDGPLEERGDVAMKKRRGGPRGGVKNRKKVRGMQIDGEGGVDGGADAGYEEVDMEDAEEWEDEEEGDITAEDIEVEPLGVSDLRELLSTKTRPGPAATFSAAAAGVVIPDSTGEGPPPSPKADAVTNGASHEEDLEEAEEGAIAEEGEAELDDAQDDVELEVDEENGDGEGS